MTAEGTFPKSDGDILYASEINFVARPIMEVYTGTGFDSASSSTNSDEGSYELTAITSTKCESAEYVKVSMMGYSDLSAGTNDSAKVELKAQIKETGESYADIEGYQIYVKCGNSDGSTSADLSATYVLLSPLTAGMKTNGFQIKAFSQCTTVDATASWTNIQTVVELA